ncbi:hypothetical protein MUP01_04715 [Candidatus Bathyarchaeota archaeon]|nr:hypothetical protein [Candidatus Bathyarchaeota archaeon]
MHLFKKLINIAVKFMLRLSPEPPEPRYPSSRALKRTFGTLFHVYRVENERHDIYGDRHFGNLLNFTFRALMFLSEKDRYYRMWLAFIMLRLHDELDDEIAAMTLDDLKRLQLEQWELPIFDIVTQDHFNRNRRMLFEMVTANTLPNLVRLAASNRDCPQP